jgi:hypothetical protein
MSRETMKHTPGPWTVRHDQGNPYVSADHGKPWNYSVVCSLYEDVTPSDSVTIGPWLKANENAEANALLIAAAPDLLDVVKEANAELERLNDPRGFVSIRQMRIMEKARAAIAKATGGEV